MDMTSSEAERARLRPAAYHEVGHAVAAHLLRFTLRAISIVPGAGYAGRCSVDELHSEAVVPGLEETPRRDEELAVVAAAGRAAQRLIGIVGGEIEGGRADTRDGVLVAQIGRRVAGDEAAPEALSAFVTRSEAEAL